jgi:hypothetical protein
MAFPQVTNSSVPGWVRPTLVARWGARLLGLGLALMFAVFWIADGMNPLSLTGREALLLSAMIVAVAGMLILWWREAWGGCLVILGMGAFYAIEVALTGHLPRGPVIYAFIVPGILALLARYADRSRA